MPLFKRKVEHSRLDPLWARPLYAAVERFLHSTGLSGSFKLAEADRESIFFGQVSGNYGLKANRVAPRIAIHNNAPKPA